MSESRFDDSDLEDALRDPYVWTQTAGVWFACRLSDQAPVEVLNTPAGPVEWPLAGEELESLLDYAARLVAEREPSNPALLATFSDVARRLREDRTSAAVRVNRLLDMDPTCWRPLLERDPAYCTIGVVEGILASVEKTAHLTWRCFELTTLVTEIVPRLDPSWPAVMRAQVASEAWREHALALLNLGRYPAAEEAAQRAFAHVEENPALAIDRALAQYVEGTAALRQGRHDDALPLARTAARTFLDFGDKQRYVKARLLEGYSLYEARRLQECTELWTSLIAEAEAIADDALVAILYNNVGDALRNIGKLTRARTYLSQALASFKRLGRAYAPEVPRVHMAIAFVTLQAGDINGALAEMLEARRLFAALQMGAGVAAAELNLTEMFIVLERLDEAEELCVGLPTVFREFGMTGSALEAAAFLKECAAEKQLRVPHVQHVREFLRDLPQNPGRAFARPRRETGG